MYGYEILDFLKKFPEVFSALKGIISIDKIPKKLRPLEFVIVNLSKSEDNGSHWFMIKRDLFGNYNLFDPLGVDSAKEDILRRFVPENFTLSFNVNTFQSKESSSCGQFCSKFTSVV